MPTKERSPYGTQDLYLAASLLTAGAKLVTVVKKSDWRSEFLFDYGEDVEKLVQDYWDGKLMVNAQLLCLNFKSLKSRALSQTQAG